MTRREPPTAPESDLEPSADPRETRRRCLSRLGAGISAPIAVALGGIVSPLHEIIGAEEPRRPLIVRNRRPADLETPVSALDSWLTPNDVFFVRSHFGGPRVTSEPWAISVDGLVERPGAIDLDTLRQLEQVAVTAVLQCAGNGRAFFRPRIPGLAWERGAVGQAEWKGVRLRDVLERAGIQVKVSAHVHILGADGPPAPKTPAYLRSIPLDRALDPSTILATHMNGEPLPHLHGGPVRLVVPTWAGNHWMKWLRGLTVSEREAPGFYMQTGYRMPRSPVPPDVVVAPADLLPVTTMNIKSLITAPTEGVALDSGPLEVRGVAWTGEGVVERVEVAIDSLGWRDATLLDPPLPGAWRRWSARIGPRGKGPLVIRSRATDSRGQSQPEATPWNKSGYLWNGIDQVTCVIG